MPDLTRWLAGFDKPSMGTFLKVIDILLEENEKSRFTPAANEDFPAFKKIEDGDSSG